MRGLCGAYVGKVDWGETSMSDTTQIPDNTAPDTEASDDTADNTAERDNDPFQVGQLFAEALRAIAQETDAEQAEAQAVETLTTTYQNYVQEYTDVFAKSWQSSMQVYQAEIDNWQAEMAKAQATLQSAATLPTPPASPVSADHLQTLKQRLAGIKDEVAAKANKVTSGKASRRKSASAPTPAPSKPAPTKP